jgi:hypothetical protein
VADMTVWRVTRLGDEAVAERARRGGKLVVHLGQVAKEIQWS